MFLTRCGTKLFSNALVNAWEEALGYQPVHEGATKLEIKVIHHSYYASCPIKSWLNVEVESVHRTDARIHTSNIGCRLICKAKIWTATRNRIMNN